jgi:hypothetical protein
MPIHACGKIWLLVVIILSTDLLLSPLAAEESAVKKASRLSCEAKTIAQLQQRRDSGLDVAFRETPLPPPTPVSDDELVASCKAYILRTGLYHPACKCPL